MSVATYIINGESYDLRKNIYLIWNFSNMNICNIKNLVV